MFQVQAIQCWHISGTIIHCGYVSGHNAAICSLASDGDQMVSTDDDGNICVWQVAGDSFREISRIPGARSVPFLTS